MGGHPTSTWARFSTSTRVTGYRSNTTSVRTRPATCCLGGCWWSRVSRSDSLTEREVGSGQAWHNGPGLIHTIEALEDSDVLEASTPFLDDVIRLRITTAVRAPARLGAPRPSRHCLGFFRCGAERRRLRNVRKWHATAGGLKGAQSVRHKPCA